MKSYLTIVTLCFVLVIVVFVGHHLDTPGRADRERSTLLGGGSGVGDRVAAIGQINVAVAKEESSADETTSVEVAAAASAAVDGKQVYNAGAWVDRIGAGLDTLVAHAIDGFQGSQGMMPAKGGNPSLSDEEVRAVVEYMVAESQ